MMRRRAVLGAGAAGALAALAGPGMATPVAVDWQKLAAEVKAEMAWAWAEYRKIAWGQDEVRPVSGTGKSFLIPGQTVGLSIVEALDTLWLMGLDAEFEDGVRWIKTSLRFDLDGDAQIFEATIRLVGGLLSGHLASGDARLLELAHDLATRMMPAFDTPTGMPMRFVNLKTGKTRDAHSFPAEIGGGMAPEFLTLSRLTGEKRFGEAAVNAMLALYAKRSSIGLIADTIDVTTGAWVTRTATVGPPTDSYLEYLWDSWRLTGDPRLRDAYHGCTTAILAHLADRSTGELWFANVDFETGATIDLVQSELSAFYPGLLCEGGNRREALIHMQAWVGAQDRYGILPEEFDAASWSVKAASNALRPELADSAFTLWLHDHDERWRHVARTHFLNMRRWNKAAHGYSGLTDVAARPPAFNDACPGYWWSEQMKYYWLIFSDCARFDYRDNYLSTEGNVLKGLKR
jgi:mannosyl-oligosaccharide alpha-1,2-mannosidase